MCPQSTPIAFARRLYAPIAIKGLITVILLVSHTLPIISFTYLFLFSEDITTKLRTNVLQLTHSIIIHDNSIFIATHSLTLRSPKNIPLSCILLPPQFTHTPIFISLPPCNYYYTSRHIDQLQPIRITSKLKQSYIFVHTLGQRKQLVKTSILQSVPNETLPVE